MSRQAIASFLPHRQGEGKHAKAITDRYEHASFMMKENIPLLRRTTLFYKMAPRSCKQTRVRDGKGEEHHARERNVIVRKETRRHLPLAMLLCPREQPSRLPRL